jgi:ABC-type antimicrobial peptide transport system permease subunit
MMTVWISLGVALLAFAFGVAGLHLQRLLPEPHTSERSRDMIAAIVGLISLLLALVLGTLVGSAYSFFTTQKTEIETFAARSIHLDLALAEFGPETAPARARMKQQLQDLHDMVWGENAVEAADALLVAEPIPHIKELDEYVASLDPKTPAQRQFAAAAAADIAALEQTRLLISLQLASSVSWPLVVIVVSWALILFCGYGVLSRLNATTLTALGFGAFAVGSALFLILELSQPFTGVFRIPSGAYDQMLASLDK